MIVNIKKIYDDAIIPTNGSEKAAGSDLYAYLGTQETYSVSPGETVKIGTGICMEIPDGYFGAIYARSGLATRNGLRPANCVGVIDSDYRGEIIVAIHNDSEQYQTINNYDRIAQVIITPYLPVVFVENKELSDTKRGDGGFGSTGVSCDA